MPKRQVFFSFHFDNDVMRVQQIRNIGVIEGNTPVSVNAWEDVKRKGEDSIKQWIDENMKNKSCVIVLVGKDTASRPWVTYEIVKAWNDGKPVFGIHIHNIKCPKNGTSTLGSNPFDGITLGQNGKKLSTVVQCYDPKSYDAYNDIASNIDSWIETAIKGRSS